jgi:hypothetical protein
MFNKKFFVPGFILVASVLHRTLVLHIIIQQTQMQHPALSAASPVFLCKKREHLTSHCNNENSTELFTGRKGKGRQFPKILSNH